MARERRWTLTWRRKRSSLRGRAVGCRRDELRSLVGLGRRGRLSQGRLLLLLSELSLARPTGSRTHLLRLRRQSLLLLGLTLLLTGVRRDGTDARRGHGRLGRPLSHERPRRHLDVHVGRRRPLELRPDAHWRLRRVRLLLVGGLWHRLLPAVRGMLLGRVRWDGRRVPGLLRRSSSAAVAPWTWMAAAIRIGRGRRSLGPHHLLLLLVVLLLLLLLQRRRIALARHARRPAHALLVVLLPWRWLLLLGVGRIRRLLLLLLLLLRRTRGSWRGGVVVLLRGMRRLGSVLLLLLLWRLLLLRVTVGLLGVHVVRSGWRPRDTYSLLLCEKSKGGWGRARKEEEARKVELEGSVGRDARLEAADAREGVRRTIAQRFLIPFQLEAVVLSRKMGLPESVAYASKLGLGRMAEGRAGEVVSSRVLRGSCRRPLRPNETPAERNLLTPTPCPQLERASCALSDGKREDGGEQRSEQEEARRTVPPYPAILRSWANHPPGPPNPGSPPKLARKRSTYLGVESDVLTLWYSVRDESLTKLEREEGKMY